MQKSFVSILIISILLSYTQAQQQKLIAVEYDNSDINRNYFLTAYIFNKGNLTRKDTIIQFENSRGQLNYLHFDLEKTTLKDNYLISSNIIIDTKSKVSLWKNEKSANSFQLYKILGDSVIFISFTTNNSEEKTTFYCYDLENKVFSEMPKGTKIYSNQFESKVDRYKISPNGRKAIYAKQDYGQGLSNNIHLIDLYYKPINTFKSLNKNLNEKIIAKDISYNRMGNVELSKVGTIWLDNETILYADYEYPGEEIWYPKGNVHLYKYNVTTDTKERICQIDSISTSLFNWFEIDAKNKVFYKAADNNLYYLDLENRKYDTSTDYFISNSISYSYTLDSRLKNYKYKTELIASLKTRNHLSTENILACESDEVPYRFGHPQEIFIWSIYNKNLSSIIISEFAQLIGWIEE